MKYKMNPYRRFFLGFQIKKNYAFNLYIILKVIYVNIRNMSKSDLEKEIQLKIVDQLHKYQLKSKHVFITKTL